MTSTQWSILAAAIALLALVFFLVRSDEIGERPAEDQTARPAGSDSEAKPVARENEAPDSFDLSNPPDRADSIAQERDARRDVPRHPDEDARDRGRMDSVRSEEHFEKDRPTYDEPVEGRTITQLESKFGPQPKLSEQLESDLENPPPPELPENWQEIISNPPSLPPDVQDALDDPPPVSHDPEVERMLLDRPPVELPPGVQELIDNPQAVPAR